MRAKLHELQRERDMQRGRRTLSTAKKRGSGDQSDGSEADDASSAEEGDADLRDMDLRVSVDVAGMARSASVALSRGDVYLQRYIIAAAQYPRFAVAEGDNSQRREQDARFCTSAVGDVVVHPGSCLAGNATSIGSRVGGPGCGDVTQ
jgi:hypothetical protein